MVQTHERRVLAALLFGNFAIGTGILLPAGMLTELARDLDVSIPTAGTMMLVSGIVVALGAPIAAALTTTFNRRILLTTCLVLYGLAHLASAMAPTFLALVVIRVFLAVPAAVFTPQAAATVGALLPIERRATAIATIFIGWSLASVAGVPLGGYLGHTLGWRAAMLIVAALTIVAAFAVAMIVPRNVASAPLHASSWREVATSKALMSVLLVTLISGAGQFSLFTYLTHYLHAKLTSDPGITTLALAWYGISATVGNLVASRLLVRISPSRLVLMMLLFAAVGMSAWGVLSGTLAGTLVAMTIWGFGTFATISIQQARLAGIAPTLTSASIALNTSAIYLGQATGSAIGGTLIGAGFLSMVPYVGAGVLLLAAVLSLTAERWEPRNAMFEPKARSTNAT
jgi:predicted MFS family arabinose efflux permease